LPLPKRHHTEHWSKKISSMSPIWSNRTPSSDEMRRTQTFDLGGSASIFYAARVGRILTSNPPRSALNLIETSRLRGKAQGGYIRFPYCYQNTIFIAYVNLANPYSRIRRQKAMLEDMSTKRGCMGCMAGPRLQGFMRHVSAPSAVRTVIYPVDQACLGEL